MTLAIYQEEPKPLLLWGEFKAKVSPEIATADTMATLMVRWADCVDRYGCQPRHLKIINDRVTTQGVLAEIEWPRDLLAQWSRAADHVIRVVMESEKTRAAQLAARGERTVALGDRIALTGGIGFSLGEAFTHGRRDGPDGGGGTGVRGTGADHDNGGG